MNTVFLENESQRMSCFFYKLSNALQYSDNNQLFKKLKNLLFIITQILDPIHLSTNSKGKSVDGLIVVEAILYIQKTIGKKYIINLYLEMLQNNFENF